MIKNYALKTIIFSFIFLNYGCATPARIRSYAPNHHLSVPRTHEKGIMSDQEFKPHYGFHYNQGVRSHYARYDVLNKKIVPNVEYSDYGSIALDLGLGIARNLDATYTRDYLSGNKYALKYQYLRNYKGHFQFTQQIHYLFGKDSNGSLENDVDNFFFNAKPIHNISSSKWKTLGTVLSLGFTINDYFMPYISMFYDRIFDASGTISSSVMNYSSKLNGAHWGTNLGLEISSKTVLYILLEGGLSWTDYYYSPNQYKNATFAGMLGFRFD